MSTTKKPSAKSAPRKKAGPREMPAEPAMVAQEATPAETSAPPAPEDAALMATKDPLRKKELVERVVARSGLKAQDARPVIEAVLAELGETMAEGRGLVLPPLGRVKITREKKLPNGRLIVVRVRQNDAAALKVVPAEK